MISRSRGLCKIVLRRGGVIRARACLLLIVALGTTFFKLLAQCLAFFRRQAVKLTPDLNQPCALSRGQLPKHAPAFFQLAAFFRRQMLPASPVLFYDPFLRRA